MFGQKKQQNVDLEIFTIYDSKTQTYEVPSLALNHLDLQRQIINMFKDPQQAKNKFLTNAEDFSIFRIGTYDRRTGLISAQNLEHIANLHDLRALAAPEQRVIPTIHPDAEPNRPPFQLAPDQRQ